MTLLSVCMCIHCINFLMPDPIFMKLGITASEPIQNPSHQSLRLYVYPPIAARQRLGKNCPIVTRQRLCKNPPIVRQRPVERLPR
jgi:hypothetical protein